MSENHDATYMKVWYWLGALTAVEVGITFMRFLPWNVLVGGLVGLAVVKAIMVAAFFMHLKFERRTLVAVCIAPVLCSVILFVGLLPDGLLPDAR